jgi:hypothetical protein
MKGKRVLHSAAETTLDNALFRVAKESAFHILVIENYVRPVEVTNALSHSFPDLVLKHADIIM